MKVPLNWLQEYVKLEKTPSEIAASFTQLGLMLDKPLDDSGVLDLEHRMDRSDWLSIIGCARDLAAYEGVPLIYPTLYGKAGKAISKEDKVTIDIQTPSVRRFNTVVIKGIVVKESPAWLKDRLSAYGIDPINNIVDITNYCMVELGQPLHAQDIAKLPGKDITIRQAKKGEHLVTLLGTDIELDPNTFILTSGGVPTVIGGIVGGKLTGVTSDTKDIVLDAGNYDQAVIRQTSRRLKITNETVSRYDKFLNPLACEIAIKRAVWLILDLAGGEYYSNYDYYPQVSSPKTLRLRYSRLALLSGMEITHQTIKKTLKSLEYAVVEEDADSLTVEVPYFRTDVEVEDDLIADIIRIGNYANIPGVPMSTPVPVDLTQPIYNFEEKLRDLMIAQGAHEHITNSLTKSSGEEGQINLSNALTADQNALRTSLVPGLTAVLQYYAKHTITDQVVFEIGKVFRRKNGERKELRVLSAVGPDISSSLSTLVHSLGIPSYTITGSLELKIGDERIGELANNSFTLLTESLLGFYKPYTGVVSDFSHPSSLDISLIADSHVKYADILEIAKGVDSSWIGLDCNSISQLGDKTNYLITLTWATKSSTMQLEKERLLQALSAQGITSKS